MLQNWSMKKRRLILILLILAALVLSLFIYGYILVKASLPVREGIVQIKGMEDEVDIYFDEKGIPQIWAENEKDAWLAVGWLHASDRLFQMEITRRVSQGKLSEWFGDLTLKYDRQQRIANHLDLARRSLKNLEESHKDILKAYISGINQFVDQTKALPFEFYLLGGEYQPWDMIDVLALLSFQTWFSDALQNNDQFYVSLEDSVGSVDARKIIVPYPVNAPKTVPQSEILSNSKEILNTSFIEKLSLEASIVKALFSNGLIPFSLTQASNAWVISPQKSRSGRAIFANDPHLEVSRLPQFWYVVGIHTNDGQLDVVGITTPGIPAVVMGHNGDIAWAFTAAAIDVTDEYIEKVNPNNPDEYLQDKTYVPFKKRYEYIKVGGSGKIDTLLVKMTRNGPVIGQNRDGSEVYSVRWAGSDFLPAAALSSGFKIAICTNFNSFRQCVTQFAALDANWLYADKAGNIGYQLGTPIPIREFENSQTRLPGWNSDYAWKGYYKLDETPHALNPDRGWLASCNNKPDENNLTYHLPGNFADGRISRIESLLSSVDQLSVDDMKKFQMDLVSPNILKWKNEVARILLSLGEAKLAERIQRWQGNTDIHSKETALIKTWLILLTRELFEDELPDLMPQFYNQTYNRERNLLTLYFSEEGKFFDDIRSESIIETIRDMAIRAMREAIQIVNTRSWGDIQNLTMAHPLAEVPLLSSLLSLSRGPFPRSGITSTLNNSTSFWDKNGHFTSRGGPSWRFILDFENTDQTQIVIPAGQSGHPLSPHFFDFYAMWDKGKYWTLPFTKEVVISHSVSVVSMIPGE